MNSSRKLLPSISFWICLLLLLSPALTVGRSILLDAELANGAGGFALFLLFPVQFFGVVFAALLLFGLYRNIRPALIVYMVFIPFGLIGFLSFLNGGHGLPTPGYGALSSLVLTGYIVLLVGAFGITEYLAVKNLRHSEGIQK